MEQRNYVRELEISRFYFYFVALTIFITWTYRPLWSDKVSVLTIRVIYEENSAIVQAPITLHHFEQNMLGKFVDQSKYIFDT
jgi:hypothetical protein